MTLCATSRRPERPRRPHGPRRAMAGHDGRAAAGAFRTTKKPRL